MISLMIQNSTPSTMNRHPFNSTFLTITIPRLRQLAKNYLSKTWWVNFSSKKNFFFGLYSDTRIKNSLTHYLPSYPVLPWSYLLPTAQNLSLSLDEIFSMRVFNWSQKAMQDQYQMLMMMTNAKRPSNLLLQLERSIDMFPPSGLLKRPPILCHTYTKVD